MLKKISILLTIIMIAACGCLMFSVRMEKKANAEVYQAEQDRIDELRGEKTKLQNERKLVRKKDHSKNQENTKDDKRHSVLISYQSVSELVYEEIYPLMKEQGFTGSLIFRNLMLPGDEGRITAEQAGELHKNGWAFVIGAGVSLQADDLEIYTEKFEDYMQDYIDSFQDALGFKPDAVYFNAGYYSRSLNDRIKNLGIHTVYYEGAYIANEDKDLTFVHVFNNSERAAAWKESTPGQIMTLKMDVTGESLTDPANIYSKNNLKNLINNLQEEEENGVIKTVQALDLLAEKSKLPDTSEPVLSNMSLKEIDSRLKEIEQEIYDIYHPASQEE